MLILRNSFSSSLKTGFSYSKLSKKNFSAKLEIKIIKNPHSYPKKYFLEEIVSKNHTYKHCKKNKYSLSLLVVVNKCTIVKPYFDSFFES